LHEGQKAGAKKAGVEGGADYFNWEKRRLNLITETLWWTLGSRIGAEASPEFRGRTEGGVAERPEKKEGRGGGEK